MIKDDFFYGTTAEDERVSACAKDIESSIFTIINTVEKIRDDVVRLWGIAVRQRKNVLKRDLSELQGTVKSLLMEGEVQINGAGFVAAPNVFSDASLHLEWWREGLKPGHFIPLKVNLNEGGDTFYDYPNMPWFYKPEMERVGHVIGPYVDMMGVDMYICTFSIPVIYGQEFIGIAGADVPLNTLEAVVVPHLMSHEDPIVLVNEDLRIISSNSPEYLVGEFFRAHRHSGKQSYYNIDLGYSVESWRLVSLQHTA